MVCMAFFLMKSYHFESNIVRMSTYLSSWNIMYDVSYANKSPDMNFLHDRAQSQNDEHLPQHDLIIYRIEIGLLFLLLWNANIALQRRHMSVRVSPVRYRQKLVLGNSINTINPHYAKVESHVIEYDLTTTDWTSDLLYIRFTYYTKDNQQGDPGLAMDSPCGSWGLLHDSPRVCLDF